jgi:PST family polysaccharide transporter
VSSAPLKQRALRGATWAAIGGNGAQVLSFVMFVAISRVVGPAAFGAVAVCLLLLEIGKAFTSESVAVNLIARGRFDLPTFNAGFVLSFGMSLVGAIALVLAAPLAATLFRIQALHSLLPLLAPLLPINALARLFEAELTIRMEFRALAIRSLAAVLLGGGVGIFNAYQGAGVGALVAQQWVGAVVSLVLLALQARWRPNLRFERDVFATLARHSLILSPAASSPLCARARTVSPSPLFTARPSRASTTSPSARAWRCR